MLEKIKTYYYTSIVLCLIFVILFETDILPIGFVADDKQGDFIISMLMEIMTVCCIPFALRLIKSNRKLEIRKYWRMAWLRLSLLIIPMIANTILYYSYMNVAFGYLAIILFLCLFFVRPTKERVSKECVIEQ